MLFKADCLGPVPGETVKYKASACVLRKMLLDDLNHYIIRHQFPGFHKTPGLFAQSRSQGDLLSEEFSRGNMLNGQIFRYIIRLGPFSGPRRSQENEFHCQYLRGLPKRPFLVNPS